jgi:alkyldihydroxyacetonephosphate synthase
MKRWNGWGEVTKDHPLPEAAAEQLVEWVGPGTPPDDISWEAALAQVPPSRLPDHPLVDANAAPRLLHARGQSLPDWIALRTGRVPAFPDGVAFPTNDDEVRALLAYARQRGVALIPYGGGTSVVGHINPLPGDRPVLTVDMGRLNRLRRFDEREPAGNLWRWCCRARPRSPAARPRRHPGPLPAVLRILHARRLDCQSLQRAAVARLRAHRGPVRRRARREPCRPLHLPATFPASAAGPELRQLVLGSEGRLGIITEATVRASPLPEREDFHAVFFPDFDSGRAATQRSGRLAFPCRCCA